MKGKSTRISRVPMPRRLLLTFFQYVFRGTALPAPKGHKSKTFPFLGERRDYISSTFAVSSRIVIIHEVKSRSSSNRGTASGARSSSTVITDDSVNRTLSVHARLQIHARGMSKTGGPGLVRTKKISFRPIKEYLELGEPIERIRLGSGTSRNY